jgi:hypothetical protein
MAVFDVTISKVSANKCTVDPSAVTLSVRDDINWVNDTSDAIIVFFPHDQVLGRPILKDHFHRKIKAGKEYTQKGPSGASSKGSYLYAIYCAETGTFAVGSDPEIIVQ